MSISDLKRQLSKKPVLADGAFGTYLLSKLGIKLSSDLNDPFVLPDFYNIEKPELVESIHLEYLKAGSDIICINSLNGSSIGLKRFGLENRVADINQLAVANAQKAKAKYLKRSQKDIYIAGVIGPTEFSLSDQNSPYTFDDLKKSYSEQIKIFIEKDIDLLLIETIYDLKNSLAAIESASEILSHSHKTIDIWLSIAVNKNGLLYSGDSITDFTNLVKKVNPLIIGINCVEPFQEISDNLKELKQNTNAFISFAPSAGIPDKSGEYPVSEQISIDTISNLLNEKIVDIVGGCCGTTPSLISKLRTLIDT